MATVVPEAPLEAHHASLDGMTHNEDGEIIKGRPGVRGLEYAGFAFFKHPESEHTMTEPGSYCSTLSKLEPGRAGVLQYDIDGARPGDRVAI